jgi:CxxC-x17-CxxC domain-containing protein
MVYCARRRESRLLCVSGDRTQAVRRSSVACQGYQSASDFGTSPLSSSPLQRSPQRWVCLERCRSDTSGQLARGASVTGRKVASLATDQTLRCRECGRDFVFTAGEQEFYMSRGLTNTPSRCPECRAARKAAMSGGGGGYQSDRPARQMYTATCSSCGREARVPFQPRGDKPVYCSDCFQQQGSSSRSNYGSRW